MTSPQQQNPDGSWSPAQPLGWQGSGIDWEVYAKGPERPRHEAYAYDEDVLVEVVRARTRVGLSRKMRKAMQRLGETNGTVL